MTDRKEKTKAREGVGGGLALFVFLLLSAFIIAFSGRISAATLYGIRLSVLNVIPSLFPFFILSDFFISTVDINTDGLPARGFGKAFGVSPSGIKAFVLGALGGFPLGVKCAVELYKGGEITKEELERLVGSVNNPSPAFVISAVGVGMLGSIKHGIVLYVSVLLSAVLVGLTFRGKHQDCLFSHINIRQKFDLVSSIKSAAYSSLIVSSYIIFFSALIGALSLFVRGEASVAIISALLEIGNASARISSLAISEGLRISLLGFALGFSGLSVHLQAFALLPQGVSRKRYLLMKTLQGIICALISTIALVFV